MTNKVRRIDFYPDEYVTGVGGVLTAAEQGVYWMICTLIMSEGGPIRNDPRRIGGLVRMRPAEVRKIIEKLLQTGKLYLGNEGQLAQKRAQSSVEKAANRIQKASENGSKGGRPKQNNEQKQRDVKADGFPDEKTNHQPTTSNQQPYIPPSPDGDVPPKKPPKGSRLPDDWEPTADDRTVARQEGLTDGECDREADKFRDYWTAIPGQRGVKRDWPATWRNWVRRRADERASNRGGGNSGGGGKEPRSRLADYAEVAAELDLQSRSHPGWGHTPRH